MLKKISLNNKISLLIAIIAISNIIFMYTNIKEHLSQKETNSVKNNLLKAVSTAAAGINFRTHNKVYNKYLGQEKDIHKSKAFKKIKKKLIAYKDINHLKKDIYTVFIPYWAKESMVFLTMSAKKSFLGNGVKATKLINEVYKTKKPAISKVYKTEQGTWISGAAPILDKKGNVHAVLQMDIDAIADLMNIVESSMKKVMFQLVGFSIFGLILILICVRVFTNKLVKSIKSVSSSIDSDIKALNKETDDIKNVGNNLLEITDSLSENAKKSDKLSGEVKEVVNKMSHDVQFCNTEMVECENACQKGFDDLEILEKEITKVEKMINNNNQEVLSFSKGITEILEIVSNIELKTQSIESISSQIKLLSFNASIEAARAGEAGKGFSVVASEMGNLANISSSSSKEIDDIIKVATDKVQTIVDSFENKVTHMNQESSKAAVALNDKREDSLNSFKTLMDKVILVKDLSAKLEQSFTKNDLAIALQDMSESIHKILDISQMNLNEANNSCNLSKELYNRSKSLKEASSKLCDILGIS